MLLLRKNNYSHRLHICAKKKLILIPINQVPASYILKFSPSHLMASFLSSNFIPFCTCCCMIFNAFRISEELFCNNSDFKLCILSAVYFSFPEAQRGRKQENNHNNKMFSCLFMPEFCSLTSVLTFVLRINIFYLTN